ncbi:MAG: leucine-rich repeat protein [Candidatus Azobacteroides sp.]|nr:leucine-rich repeat protein [Candidatus Azobacteroides sp.]
MKTKNLLLTVLIAFAAINATAQTWNCGYPNVTDVTATLSDGTMTISGTGEMGEAPWYNVSNQIRNLVIEFGVTSISSSAFHNCSNLTSVTISNSVISIDDWALFGCGFTSITIPESVTSIGSGALAGCLFSSITIPNSVTNLGDYAFEDCENLTAVTIGAGVTRIGDWAFVECTALSSVTCLIPDPSGITMGDYVFDGVDLENCVLMVPDGSVDLYKNASQWKDFSTIEETNEGGGVVDTHLANLSVNAGTLSLEFSPTKYVYTVAVPYSVEKIMLTAVPVDDGVVVSGDGLRNLNVGENRFEITVSASERNSVYMVIITRDIPHLASLTVSAGTLSPEFSPTAYVYSVAVPQSVESITLTAVPADDNVVVSGDGPKSLNVGENRFEITVGTPEENSVYTVIVIRMASDYLLELTGFAEKTTGNLITTYFDPVTNRNATAPVIDRYELEYVLSTGSLSGDIPLHFEIENGRYICDKTINVSPNSIYTFTLYLDVNYREYSDDITFTTHFDSYGRPSYVTIGYSRHLCNVIASDGNNVLSADEINITGSSMRDISVSDPVFIGTGNFSSVKELSAVPGITVFPNPATDYITISGLQGGETLYFYTIGGQLLFSRQAAGETERIAVGHLPAGLYFVKTGGKTLKWVKQ